MSIICTYAGLLSLENILLLGWETTSIMRGPSIIKYSPFSPLILDDCKILDDSDQAAFDFAPLALIWCKTAVRPSCQWRWKIAFHYKMQFGYGMIQEQKEHWKIYLCSQGTVITYQMISPSHQIIIQILQNITIAEQRPFLISDIFNSCNNYGIHVCDNICWKVLFATIMDFHHF